MAPCTDDTILHVFFPGHAQQDILLCCVCYGRDIKVKAGHEVTKNVL